MASSSSSLTKSKYDVFVSFRGADIRDTFLSFLSVAFKAQGINAFTDTELERGEEISSGLLRAIEESKVALIIFSQNYASSPWCLEELIKIMECRKTYKQRVVPVFYRVDPEHVENQTGSYGEAFSKHEKEVKDKKLIETWRKALTDISYISGWDSKNIRPDAALVETIVKDIASKLKKNFLDLSRDGFSNNNNTTINTSNQSQNRQSRLQSRPSSSDSNNSYTNLFRESQEPSRQFVGSTTNKRAQQAVPQSQSSKANTFSSNFPYTDLIRETEEASMRRAREVSNQMKELEHLQRLSASPTTNVKQNLYYTKPLHMSAEANNNYAEIKKREMQALSDQMEELNMQRLSQIKTMYNIN